MQRMHYKNSHRRIRAFPGSILTLAGILLTIVALLFPANALASTSVQYRTTASSCPVAGDVTNQSLLVVLLDRSGSLTYEPGATDPDGYSTSVTKALADLWPGSMTVIPFSNDTTPVFSANLSDPAQREQLKQQIESYPIGGDTPLAPAMHKALDLLHNASSGSRVIIVTDGSPDPVVMNGIDQTVDIRTNLIPQFCRQGIPVNAFGLALDLTSQDGQTANKLLQDIATGTGGKYQNVKDSTELAQVVIQLYADWQHLVFQAQAPGKSNYTIPIDTYAKKVTFVTFRANNSSAITLTSPSGQTIPAQVLQRSTDRHYEIDNLVLSTINQPGSYGMAMADDASNQVYTLVETRLHVQLLQPTAQTTAYIGTSLDIQAQLVEDATTVLPKTNEATMNAGVTVLVNGQTVSNETVELTQNANSPIFEGHTTLPGPVGQVHIQIVATYLQIPVEASEAQVTIPLVKPAVKPKKKSIPGPPPVPGCGTNIACYWQRYAGFIIGVPLALLLLLLLLLWNTRPGPTGTLIQGRDSEELSTLRRSLFRRLFSKSTLNSHELEQSGFRFDGASFDLIFSKVGAHIRATRDEPKVTIKKRMREQLLLSTDKSGVVLDNNDAINVAHCPSATYKSV